MDVKVFNESGKGYWMDGVGCLRANETNGMGAHIVCLNDQGGKVMDVSDKAATLRAQEHGHQPVICFEPGIMSRDCSAGNRAYIDVCSTLRAQMGDNKPAVCYGISRSMLKGGMNAGGMPVEEEIQPSITANGCGAVCINSSGLGIAAALDASYYKGQGVRLGIEREFVAIRK